MAFSACGRLRHVFSIPGLEDENLDIILIPGIGTPPVETWPFFSKQWLQDTLPSTSARPRVLAFQHGITLGNSFSWEMLLMQGFSLLIDLVDLRSNTDKHRPIICVCHSLGGTVLKQSLCIANEQLDRYGVLINAISGIIFISSPHAAATKDGTHTLYTNVLEAMPRKLLKLSNTEVDRDSTLLCDLANRFEAIDFHIPVLSVYETEKSKIAEGLFKSRMQIVGVHAYVRMADRSTFKTDAIGQLVDYTSCETHSLIEKFVGVPLDHMHSCHFHQTVGDGLLILSQFLGEALQNAEELISTRLEARRCLTSVESKHANLNDSVESTYTTVSSYSPPHSELALREGEQAQMHPIVSSADGTDGSSQLGFEVIPISHSMDFTRAKPRLPCIMLGRSVPNPNFYGREQVMNLLKEALLPSNTRVVSSQSTGLKQFALCGLGGMGKTEIAQEFASTFKDEFDAVFWVTADEPAKLDICFQQISAQLGLESISESKRNVVSRELVKGWLSKPWRDLSNETQLQLGSKSLSEASWLLIFDNADDPYLLTDYWPQGNGSVLITSRDPLAKSIFSTRTSGIDLESLSDIEGASLLIRLTGNQDEDDAEGGAQELAVRISQVLGGIPMAIYQMAGIIRRQGLTLRQFIDLYNDPDEHANLHGMEFDSITQSYPHTIATAWAIEKLKSKSRRLLESMIFFDPDNIKECLLIELSTSLFSTRKDDYREARTELLQTSLIRWNKQNDEISVHRLVQDAVRAKLDDATIRTIFGGLVHLLWANWPSAMPEPSRTPQHPQPKANNKRLEVGRWPLCASLYPHVLKLHQHWTSIGDIPDTIKIQFASLLNDAAWYQSERGQTRGFDGFFDTAQTLCENVIHPDKDELLSNIYFCLGAIAADTNNHEASRRYKELSFDLQYKISQDIGRSGERLALAYSERSISRIQDGRVYEGIHDLKREKEIRVAMGTYVPLSREANLGLAYLLQGNLDKCEALLMDSLETRQKTLGKNDKESFRTGRILYALGNLRAVQGKLDRSYSCHQQAYEQFRSTIGDHNHRTADIQHKIAEHLIRLNKNEEAIKTINSALKTWSLDATAYKPELARTTFLKAKLLQSLGKDQEAAEALKVSNRLRTEVTRVWKKSADLTMVDFDELVTFWSR